MTYYNEGTFVTKTMEDMSKLVEILNHEELDPYGFDSDNAQMMSYAKEGIPALVAFWDGKSRGTKNMINTADNGRTFVRVIRYDS